MDEHQDRQVIRIELGFYSVQWFDADPGPCCRCAGEVGAGPAGFSTDEPAGPLCDACLITLHKGMGNVLWVINMVREVAELAEANEDPHGADLLMITLMAFAKMYHLTSDWPNRDANAQVFMDTLRKQMQNAPWSDLMAPPN